MTKKFAIPTPLALCLVATPTFAQTDTERLDQLELQISSLQQEISSAAANRVRFNGFFSTGYARGSNDAGFAGITEKSEVKDLSLMALQGAFSLTNDTQAIMQLISRGEEDWDTSLEWAYLSHQLTNDIQIRAGKMRLPYFMYSDSLELGYAQPWARPPEAVYGVVPVKSYVGADSTYTYNLDGSSITAQLFAGHSDEPATQDEIDVEARNLYGLSLSWTNYVWSARAIVSTASATVSIPSVGNLANGDRVNFAGLGFSYDDGTWQIVSEVTRIELDSPVPDSDSAYISVGHRFGNLTPYALIGWTESKDDERRAGSPLSALDDRRDEYSLGVRWDVISGVALKFDWTHARGFGEEPGVLNTPAVFAENLNSTNVYTVKIDSAF